ncbi:TPA: hypothetical protein ACOEOJ_004281, partial [Stenotrophomonas maltophilia]
PGNRLSAHDCSGGDSLPDRASVPVAGIATTAPAVFDGYRGRCTANDAFKCHDHGTEGTVTA